MAEADRVYIPYGLNRIRTSRDLSEEPSSSGGDDSPSRRNAMLWDGHRLAVPRVKVVGDGGRRAGNGKGFRKGRKVSRGCGSYLGPKDSSKPSKRIPFSSQAKRSGHLADLKEMTRQLVQESNLARKAHATQKSFSYELASRRGIQQPQSRAHSYSDLKELLGSFHTKFEAAKEAVNADLAAFVADVVNDLKKGTLSGEQETAEYLVSLSHKCIEMEPPKFRDECESIVHNVAECWRKSKLVHMKQLLTRMLFILTRCSRIRQLQNDSNPINEESLSKFKQCIERVPDRKWGPWYEIAGFETSKISDQGWSPKHASEDHNEVFGTSANVHTKLGGASPGCHRTSDSIIKKLHDIYDSNSFCEQEDSMVPDLVICRICEEKVPASLLESHSYVCAFADKCDLEGFDFDERLVNIAEVLEQLVESYNQSSRASCSSPDISRMQSNISVNGLEGFSPMAQDSHQIIDWMFEDIHEMDTASIDDPLTPASRHWKSLLAMKLGSCFPASSNGSLSPASSITTPRSSHMDLFWLEHNATPEPEDVNQLVELVEIARKAARVDVVSKDAFEYLDICWEDLSHILYNKPKSLIIDTFGKRVKNLLKDKYLRAMEVRDGTRLESIIHAETNDNVLQNPSESKTFLPVHLSHKEKTGIDDFEIIKPISRGAYGRVFLAKKRQTGDFFAIKVLKKLDMIRKNDIERILAERNILITVRNPFVVRFFYSFTCRDNLYLVMEYLNGGDLYSILRKVGCLEEGVARIYLAELVLALEYLHSLGIIHRDLKPDNILIACDGHIKLTDFGLSKIGLINHSIDLPGNSESEKEDASTENAVYKGKENGTSAVGTPDYLAPEILLGTGHDCAADWWSVGIILFELLTGIPPFTARFPEMIFDNILNRKIPWPHVPNDMSHEAKDLIDRLLVLDPHQRLGANGASEVKAHNFFKEIDWVNLALQKAAFVPQPDSTDDTSYFISRYASHSSQIEDDEISGDCTSNASNSNFYIDPESNAYEEEGSEPRASLDLDSINFSFKNLSQLASMNLDVLVQSSKSIRSSPQNKG